MGTRSVGVLFLPLHVNVQYHSACHIPINCASASWEARSVSVSHPLAACLWGARCAPPTELQDRDLDGFPDVLRGALQGEGLGALGTSSCFYSWLGSLTLSVQRKIPQVMSGYSRYTIQTSDARTGCSSGTETDHFRVEKGAGNDPFRRSEFGGGGSWWIAVDQIGGGGS